MADSLKLTSMLHPRGPAGAFVLTDEQVATLGGGRKAFPVSVTLNGVTLPLRLARMGGENMIGLAKAAREKAGVTLGEAYEIEVTAEDPGTRTVEVPDDLAAALAGDAEAKTRFDALAYSHRKEFVRWITEAKREATRLQRVTKTLEMLRAGEHR
jgi:Bacteriocin-protection, YdeI or OmpD-Associated/Domain of unknown function (DUF1905)